MLFTSDYSIKMPLSKALLTSLIGIMTVLMILAVIAVLIMLVSKIIRAMENKMSNKQKSTVSAQPSPSNQMPLGEHQSMGQLVLEGVDEPTAAIIMAIVSNETKIPLNRLCFKSIKLLEDEKK